MKLPRPAYPVVLACALATALSSDAEQSAPPDSTAEILEQIGELESNRDPKCYATAARLEDFMFGTPLTEEARFVKADLQKELVSSLWRAASERARDEGRDSVDVQTITEITSTLMVFLPFSDGSYELTFPAGPSITVASRDADHYLSIAYGYRAILAVQQGFLLDADPPLPLSEEALRHLRTWLDLFSLDVLRRADADARQGGLRQIPSEIYRNAFEALTSGKPDVRVSRTRTARRGDFSVIRGIIEKKLSAYEAYNEISQPVFMRNLQVYFARFRWPGDEEESEKLRAAFNESMITFLGQVLLRSQAHATERGRTLITVEEVHRALQELLPYEVNEYEDVIFFPALPRSRRITLEAYDTDAFRDSGLHWRYLGEALNDLEGTLELEPDPFAAELLTEGVAQFGVLVLRAAGMAARESDAETLALGHLASGFELIQERLDAGSNARADAERAPAIRSSADRTRPQGDFFADVTERSGIRFVHRSADWLSRQLRSYLKKDEQTGTLTIPPAFGGGGVAAADVNLDGIDDILLLGGAGNALYLGRGDGTFEDVTDRVPINRIRPDNTFGEPRQPVIADFDNDGLPDILITYVDDDHLFLRNLGELRFEDVTSRAGLGGEGLVGGPATAVDLDADGLLDIHIGYFGDYLSGELPNLSRRNLNGLPNQLFRNLGGFEFENVTEGSGTDNTGWTQAMSHTDFDGDGRQDLITGNDFGVNVWLRNEGELRFTDWAEKLGTSKPSFTMNVGIADLNADEAPDVYISNIVTMVKDEKYVLPDENTEMRFDPNKLARMRVVEANDLFLSSGGDSAWYELSDAVGRGYSSTGWSWDADFFDFDLDGDDDLYVLNGMNEYMVYSDTPYYTAVGEATEQVVLPVAQEEPNVFFVNRGGRLEYVDASGAGHRGNSRSAAYLDIDLDGDLDIVVNDYHGGAVVYENIVDRGDRNWIKVRLVGAPEAGVSRDAIGARLTVTGPGGLKVWREIHGTEGYLSVHPREQHFGVGSAEVVDLEIIWPNGERQLLENLEVNKRWVVPFGESSAEWEKQAAGSSR